MIQVKHRKTRAWPIGTPWWRTYPDLEEEEEEEKPMEKPTQITVVDKAAHNLRAGEMTFDSQTSWLIGCPGCAGPGNLGNHTIIEDETGITVLPSILCGCGAHYFVEHSQIRWA